MSVKDIVNKLGSQVDQIKGAILKKSKVCSVIGSI